MFSLADLWNNVRTAKNAEFLVCPTGVVQYKDLADWMLFWLMKFDEHELEPGDRVLMVSENEPAIISAFITCLLDGVVPVMLAPNSPHVRVEAIRASVAPKLTVADEGHGREKWVSSAFLISPTSNLMRAPSEEHRQVTVSVRRTAPRLPEDLDELAYLLFTSGTTQAPSGVMISRRNVLSNLQTLSRLFSYGPQSRIFNDMILAHADGFIQGPLLALANRCAVIRQGGFTLNGLEAWLGAVRRARATHVITVPTIWSMIDRYAAGDHYFQAPECQFLLSVAARLDPELWDRLERRFKRPLLNQYGLTETVASACYAGRAPEMGQVGTIGRPVDCEARIASGANGAMGELQLRGDNVFMGYWQDPVRTAQTFTPDGWMRTGDLAVALSDGSYQVVGRLKTVIMSAGFLIRPEEVDEALRSHPSVVQVVTIGMPDAEFDEVPVSVVVLDSDVSEADLAQHCRARLEPLKVPKRIIVVDAIPRGDAGKPRLQALKAIVEKQLSAERPLKSADWGNAVLQLAARVFREDLSRLTLQMGQDEIAGWDSFSQLNLIFAAEDQFGIHITPAQAVNLQTLADLADLISGNNENEHV